MSHQYTMICLAKRSSSSRTCAASIARLVIFVQVGSVLTTHYNDETCKLYRETILVRAESRRLYLTRILLDRD